jgi:hypothetical protein
MEKTQFNQNTTLLPFAKETTSNLINPTFKDIFNTEILKESETIVERSKPLETDISTNLFPVDVFPTTIQQIIMETNEKIGYPIDFIAASLFYAASVAIGNTHKIRIKNLYVESPVLYLALVGKKGTNKSHPLTFALGPIIKRDDKAGNEYTEQLKEYKKLLSSLKKSNVKKEPEKPIYKRIIVSNITPEALILTHNNNKRGLGMYYDELAGWFKSFNRYNSGDEEQFWLSAWSGKSTSKIRVLSEPISISKPFIPVIGTIQPSLLIELAKNRTENGFMDRFLFIVPDGLVKPYLRDVDIDNSIVDDWSNILDQLFDMPMKLDENENPVSTVLDFIPEAKEMFFDWANKNTDACNNSEDEIIKGIYSKAEMYCARFALILELLSFACKENEKEFIGVKSVEGAIKLIEYFKKMGIKASKIATKNPLDKLDMNKQTLFNSLPSTFTTNVACNIAGLLGVKQKTCERLLKDEMLFIKVKHGEYKKKID